MKLLEFEKLSPADVSELVDRGHAKAEERKRAAEERKRSAEHPSQNVLLDSTSRWIASLPSNVRPFACAHRFPRIANSIADLWCRVPQCEQYLDSLILDARGHRTGFPPDVAKELLALRNYFSDLHPRREYAWDLVERGD